MKCQRCGHVFPQRKGNYCGTCFPGPSLSAVLADVVIELLSENAHILVGGTAFAQDAMARIQAARKDLP